MGKADKSFSKSTGNIKRNYECTDLSIWVLWKVGSCCDLNSAGN